MAKDSPGSSTADRAGKSIEKIKIRVVTPSARVIFFQTSTSKFLLEFKQEILLELSDDCTALPYFATDVRQLTPRYRLIKSESDGITLNEAQTLAEHNIADNDTLVLVARRNFMQQLYNPLDMHAPTATEIDRATQDLSQRDAEVQVVDINEIFQQTNVTLKNYYNIIFTDSFNFL